MYPKETPRITILTIQYEPLSPLETNFSWYNNQMDLGI